MTTDDSTVAPVADPPDNVESEPPPAVGDVPHRSIATRVLLVVATVFALIGTLTTWVNIQLLDTDEWVELSGDLLANEDIQEALSEKIVDVVYTNVSIGDAINDELPEALDGIGGFLAGAVRDPLTDGVRRALGSEAVREAWEQANRVIHERFVAIMRGDTSDLVSTDGDLSIELRPLVINVGESLGLPSGLLDRIPEDAGSFVILDEDALDAMQTTVRLADLMRWVPVIIAVVLYAAAVALAGRGSRVWATRGVGWGLLATAVIVLLIRRLSATLVVPILVQNPQNDDIGVQTIDISTRLLSEVGRTVLWFALLILIVTAILGTGRRGTAVRNFVAPAFTGSAIALAGGAVVFVLLMLWWSPARIFEGWFSALAFLALVIVSVVVLRRAAFADARERTWSDSMGQLRRS